MIKKIRTRFAPSPTGFLHIGGLRTALFSYLIAKSQAGEIILRIEDTDQKREVEGAVEKLNQILNWTGIKFDEGPNQGGDFKPYIQSQRKDIYFQFSQKLLDLGGAYHCFCTSERLEQMREEQKQNKLAPRYDQKCRSLTQEEVKKKIDQGEKYVIRQKIPSQEEIKVKDFLRGEIKFNTVDLEDQVLIKSDNMPTYQFASVVDDHLMAITHVVRGEEWLPSFPKNVLLYQAFNWDLPEFVHLPVVLDKEGGKLSKRKNNIAVEDFHEQGYLPEALINFVALLGWHPKDDQETLNLNEIIEKFQIKDIGTSPATFDIDKLNYFNGYHIRQMDLDKLTTLTKPFLEENLNQASADYKKQDQFIKKVVSLEQERLKKLSEIGELTNFLFIEQPAYEKDLLLWKKMDFQAVAEKLQIIYQLLEEIPEENWQEKILEEKIINHIKNREEKVGDFLWPTRVTLSGQGKSPGPFEIATTLEKKEALARIKYGIDLASTD